MIKRFLDLSHSAFLVVLSGVLLLSSVALSSFFSQTANAASSWDAVVDNLDSLILKDQFGSSNTVDVTNTWLAMATDGTGTVYNALSSGQRSDLATSYVSGRYWVGLQVTQSTGISTVYIYWDNTSSASIVPCGGSPYAACGGAGWFGFTQTGTPGSNFARIQLYGSNVEVYADGQSFASAFQDNGTSITSIVQTFETSYPVTYPSGYDGQLIGVNEPPKDKKYPPLNYNIVAQRMVVNYVGVDCIQGLEPDSPCARFKLLYNIVPSGEEDSIYTEVLDPSSQFTYTFTENGDYTIAVGYVSLEQPPYANLPDDFIYVPTIIHFTIDGGSYFGDTNDCTLNEGNYDCIGNTVSCDDLADFFQVLTCKMSQSFDTGIINPSINAMKSLISSIYVPNTTTCSIILPDVPLPDGTFPISGLGSSICSNGDAMRDAFPFIAIFANFAAAIAILAMLANLFNRLLRPDDHDLIQGMGQGDGFGSNRSYVRGSDGTRRHGL